MTIHDVARRVGHMLQDNTPAILTALGVSGVVATGYFAHKAGQQSMYAVAEYNSTRAEDSEDLTAREVVELCWRFYIPPAIIILGTCSAIIGAQAVNSRRQAALFSAVSLSERALTEYRDQTREALGEKKEGEIREAVARKRLEEDPQDPNNMVILGSGEILCYDMLSGRYFKSTVETLRRAMNDVNAECNAHMYSSLNTYWTKVGLPALPLGESLGWTSDTQLDLVFSYIPDEEGRPTLAVDFRKQPINDYYSAWS